ncbi:MAG: hypothetical protein E7231_08970 [Cellulosilyticum sp.]|nr:hypothetical protein [Cellulosilyticum sp.]
MATENKLLDEFKELIETVSLEILKEAQMKEVAKDVVTRSYKNEIADALEAISGEIERVKEELKAVDYISADEIKALVQGMNEKQALEIKESEERIKNIVNQSTQELYISTEKLHSEVETVRQQVESQFAESNEWIEQKMGVMHDAVKESVEVHNQVLLDQIKKLFWVNYGLVAGVIGLVIFIIIRGNYGA